MEYEITPVGAVTRLCLRGRLDSANVEAMHSQVLDAIVPLGRHTVVDLSAVSFVASLGVRMLISATHALRQQNANVVLYGAPPLVAESLNLVIKQIIPMVATEQEALALLTT